jgi:hypothetical protein
MPSRKQRRRRAKTFRHEYEYVVVDDEGNEVEVDADELRAERKEKRREKQASRPARQTQQAKGARGGRAPREVAPPSWERAFRRGGVMGVVMLLAFVFLFKSTPLVTRIGWGVFYAVAFVPLTYWIDRTAYRGYQRRLAKRDGKSDR